MIINTYDIETFKENEEFVPYCISFMLNNEINSIYYTNESKSIILDSLNVIATKTNEKIIQFYIHNLNFDGMLIIDCLSKFSIYFRVLSVKTNLYWIEIKYGGVVFIFRCSYKILPISLRKIGEIENFAKFFFPYNFVNRERMHYIGKLPSKEYWENYDEWEKANNFFKNEEWNLKNEIILYCERDVDLLHKALVKLIFIIDQKFTNIMNFCYSTPSLAYTIFYKKYNIKKIEKKIKIKDDIYIRPSFFGGRCEVFGNLYDDEHIKYYDFSAMYAQCMKEKFHFGKNFFCEPSDFTKSGYYTISFESKNLKYPILPFRNKNNKLIFANGSGYGTYWFEEILYFMENGGKIKKIHSALVYENYDYVFNDFVDDFISIRKQGGYFNIFGKLMLNSFYGASALNLDEKMTYISYSEEEGELIMKNFTVSNFYKINNLFIFIIDIDYKYKKKFKIIDASRRNVSIASAIASKARVKLHKLFIEVEQDGGRMLYCDTDSVFGAYKKNDIRWEIGNKKWLNFFKDGIFMAPKSYGVVDDRNNLDLKLKGVSTKSINIEHLKKSFEEKKKIIFEHQKISSRKNFKIEEKKIIKTLDFSNYDKRIFIENGKNTIPRDHSYND